MENIIKSQVRVTILHRQDEEPDLNDLDAIQYAINEGPCIGNVEALGSEVVPPERVRDELLDINNDGTFFDPLD